MSIYEEALKQAEAEIGNAEISELKEYFRQILEKIEAKKVAKEKIEEEIRVLRLELDDLKEGKMDKIKERQKVSNLAREVSVLPDSFFTSFFPWPNLRSGWWTGTYQVTTSEGTKIYYF